MKQGIYPIILLLITALLSWRLERVPTQNYSSLYSQQVPDRILERKGADQPVSARALEILETRDVLCRIYEKQGKPPIYLSIVFSEDNRKAVHPPEVCYLGSGFEVIEKSQKNFGDMSLVRIVVQREFRKELTLYSFKAGARYSSSYIQQQMNILLERFRNRRAASALVKVSADITNRDTKDIAVVEEELVQFLREVKKILTEKSL